MRGHGDSEKLAYGYRMQRLAADLRAFIYYEDFADVTLDGPFHGLFGNLVLLGYVSRVIAYPRLF